MIDLHCHLLPGIDDGPQDMVQALALCRLAVEDGISHAICTPHVHAGRWENTRSSIAGRIGELRQALVEQDIALKLGFAGEVRASEQVMALVSQGELPTYGSYETHAVVLLEFPHNALPVGSEQLIDWMLRHGYRPLIAHPERNKAVMKNPDLLLPLVERGALLQLTAGSIVGDFGAAAESVSLDLLTRDLVAVVASDAHNQRGRRPRMQAAFSVVESNFGAQRAQRLFVLTPQSIVRDQFELAEC
jgi:protein-tyrosine phosphatase